MEASDPENTYKYFLSQDAWTWEQKPTYRDAEAWGRQGPQGQAQIVPGKWDMPTELTHLPGSSAECTTGRVTQPEAVECQIRDEGWTRRKGHSNTNVPMSGTNQDSCLMATSQRNLQNPTLRAGSHGTWPQTTDNSQ